MTSKVEKEGLLLFSSILYVEWLNEIGRVTNYTPIVDVVCKVWVKNSLDLP